MGKKTTRFHGKTEFNRAINNLDKCMNHFKNLLEMGYSKVPRIEATVKVATTILIDVQVMLKRARDSI